RGRRPRADHRRAPTHWRFPRLGGGDRCGARPSLPLPPRPPNPRRRRAHHSKARCRLAWSIGIWELHRAFAASMAERITYAIYVTLSSNMFTQCSILAPLHKGRKHQLAAHVSKLPALVFGESGNQITLAWRYRGLSANGALKRVLGFAVQQLPLQRTVALARAPKCRCGWRASVRHARQAR